MASVKLRACWVLSGLSAAIAACNGSLELGEPQAASLPDVIEASAPDPTTADPFLDAGASEAEPPERVWEWIHPTPTGEILSAAWAAAPNDVWIVGDNGTVLRWDGDKTMKVAYAGPNRTNFRAVSGTSSNDVWVAGPGGALHFDGASWSDVPTMALANVVALSGNIGVGADHRAVGFSAPGLGLFNAVYRAALGDNWVVGDRGMMQTTSRMVSDCKGCPPRLETLPVDLTGAADPLAPSNRYVAVAGNGPSDIWGLYTDDSSCVGLTHWNGTALRVEHTVCTDIVTYEVTSGKAGLHVSGNTVVTPYTRRVLGTWTDTRLPVRTSGRFYDAKDGRVLMYARWPSYAPEGSMEELSPDLHASLVVYDPSTNQVRPLHGSFDRDLRNLVIDATGTPWAQAIRGELISIRPDVSRADLFRFDGAWTPVSLPPGFDVASDITLYGEGTPPPAIQAIEASVWVPGTRNGSPAIYEYVDGNWVDRSDGLPVNPPLDPTKAEIAASMRCIAGTSRTNLLALGSSDSRGPPLYRFDGRRWSKLRPSCLPPFASPLGVLVNCEYELLLWDGTNLTPLRQSPPELAFSIERRATWAWSRTDLWMGETHFDGTSWRNFPVDGIIPFGGSGPNDMWFQDRARGSLIHWDGHLLQAKRSFPLLYGAASRDGTLWAVGQGGRTLRYGPKRPAHPTR